MKFASMRVQVPIDDVVPVGQVYEHLRALLEERGTEQLTLPNGEAPELETPMPAVGRIHWPAVEVVQAVDRTQRPAAKPARKSANAAT